MNELLTAIKNNLHLNSPVPLLTLVGIALLYHRRTMVWGRRWLVGAVLAYWALATPFGSWLATWPLAAGQPRIESAADAQGARAIVVLGGGITIYQTGDILIDDLDGSALRVIEGVRVYRLLGDPLLIVSGGNTLKRVPSHAEAEAFRTAAMALGVPSHRILVEDQSMTTRDEAVIIRRLLAERQIDRFVLVTSPVHMRRSVAAFRAVGLAAIPSSSALRSVNKSLWKITPERESLALSDHALYECAALAYYWWRGWLQAPRPHP